MSSIKTKKLVVFDLDGTLLDSFPLLAQAMHEVLQAHKLHTPPTELMRTQLSGGLAAMFDIAHHSNPQVTKSEWLQLRAQYLQRYEAHHLTATPLFAGVKQVLQALHAAGMQLAVCTNRDRRTSERLLTQWGLRPWLCAVASIDDMPQPKPAPDGLLALAQAQGIDLHEVLFVGDSGIDCQTAQAAGVDFHAHLPGYHGSTQELLPNTLAFSDYPSWLVQLQTQGWVPTAPSTGVCAPSFL